MLKKNCLQSSVQQLIAAILFFSLVTFGGCAMQGANIQASELDHQSSAPCLKSQEAMKKVGETACVEFFVGNPSQYKGEVFLNEMADYKKGFQAVIMPEDLDKFGDPVSKYRNKTIRVTGLIVEYDGHPGIIVRSPSEIVVR